MSSTSSVKVTSPKDLKESKPSAKVAIIAILVLPLVGLCCLLFPAIAEEALPFFLGVPMVVSGVGSMVAVARERSVDAGIGSVGAAAVLVILGLITIVHGAKSTMFIGIIWGLLGLYKAGGELDDIIDEVKAKEPYLLSLAICLFELVLAVLLILNPFANIEHHLILLSLELIIYPFKLHREHGKLKLEAEA